MLNIDAPKRVSVKEVHRFIVDCCIAVRVPEANARCVADVLSNADNRGQFSFGIHLLETFLNQLSDKTTNGAILPEILRQTPSTAWVDGRNGLGPVVGNFCMDLAMSKAKLTGLCWVCVKNSNHYGISTFYAQRAMEKGFIGISMTNSAPNMVPTRAKVSAVGANTISLAAPANEDSFVTNLSLTAASPGHIEMKYRENLPLPEGWAQDSDGKITTDPGVALETKNLLPLGGLEATGGYKGYALGALVDILSGVMAGNIHSFQTQKNFGHVFVAIDPKCFTNSFQDRMEDFNSMLRSSEPLNYKSPVLIPGDREREYMKNVEKEGGIKYLVSLIKISDSLAKRFKVTPLRYT